MGSFFPSSRGNCPINRHIKRFSEDSYKFHSDNIQFSVQRSRAANRMRPISASAFVAGNFSYVYKNCSQLSSNHDQQNLLNDVLFSHSIFPNSGAEFPLLFSVISHQPKDYVCSICLFTPVAPRVTHCGHIFCCDCIKQHLCFCDQEKFCPVCYKKISNESLVRADLRLYHSFHDHFVFRKIVRNFNDCVCFQNDDPVKNVLPTASKYSAPFCHFVLADKEYSSNLIEKEKNDLIKQIEIYSKPEFYDDMKLSLLKSTLENVLEEQVPDDDGTFFALKQKSSQSEYYRFYQDSNGRLIFFDYLSTKMLISHFGSIKKAPDRIEFDPLKIYTVSVDKRFRDRHHDLGYLPNGADVTFVLADLSKIVSPEVMKLFAARIEKRLHVEEDEILEEETTKSFTDADFPTFEKPGTSPGHAIARANSHQVSKGWSDIKLQAPPPEEKPSFDRDFPSFGAAFPKK